MDQTAAHALRAPDRFRNGHRAIVLRFSEGPGTRSYREPAVSGLLRRCAPKDCHCGSGIPRNRRRILAGNVRWSLENGRNACGNVAIAVAQLCSRRRRPSGALAVGVRLGWHYGRRSRPGQSGTGTGDQYGFHSRRHWRGIGICRHAQRSVPLCASVVSRDADSAAQSRRLCVLPLSGHDHDHSPADPADQRRGAWPGSALRSDNTVSQLWTLLTARKLLCVRRDPLGLKPPLGVRRRYSALCRKY